MIAENNREYIINSIAESVKFLNDQGYSEQDYSKYKAEIMFSKVIYDVVGAPDFERLNLLHVKRIAAGMALLEYTGEVSKEETIYALEWNSIDTELSTAQRIKEEKHDERHGKSELHERMTRMFAKDIWLKDTAEEMRMNPVAEQALEYINNETGEEYKLTTIKGWLRPIAPEYASKSGRPKKN